MDFFFWIAEYWSSCSKLKDFYYPLRTVFSRSTVCLAKSQTDTPAKHLWPPKAQTDRVLNQTKKESLELESKESLQSSLARFFSQCHTELMPVLKDYLFAPWRILDELYRLIFGHATPTPSMAPSLTSNSAPTPPAESGGGMMISFLGLDLPPLVFFASLAIFSFFAWSVYRLFRETQALKHDLTAIVRALEASAPIAEAFQKSNHAASSWTEYGKYKIEIRGQSYFTRPPSEFFTDEKLILKQINASFFALVPGTLTGLGLLVTFIAILEGLSHVTVSADMNVQGIAGLINGLSAKFLSSIIAVLCAVSFTLSERRFLGEIEKITRGILKHLNEKLPVKTSEEILLEVVSKIQ
jgi:hypothetical protein